MSESMGKETQMTFIFTIGIKFSRRSVFMCVVTRFEDSPTDAKLMKISKPLVWGIQIRRGTDFFVV